MTEFSRVLQNEESLRSECEHGNTCTVSVDQGSDAWLAMRLGKITGSKMAAACGLNPYESRAKLWRLMTGRESEGDIGSLPAPMWGTKHEPAARSSYSIVMGDFDVVETGIIIDRYDRWVAASPDGFAGGDGSIYLEAKCPFGSRTADPNPRLYDKVPSYYMPQVQGGSDVTGSRIVHFFAYVPDGWGEKIAIWEIEPNTEYQSVMRKMMREFYHHVVDHTKPPNINKRPTMPDVVCRELYRGPVVPMAAVRAGGSV